MSCIPRTPGKEKGRVNQFRWFNTLNIVLTMSFVCLFFLLSSFNNRRLREKLLTPVVQAKDSRWIFRDFSMGVYLSFLPLNAMRKSFLFCFSFCRLFANKTVDLQLFFFDSSPRLVCLFHFNMPETHSFHMAQWKPQALYRIIDVPKKTACFVLSASQQSE